MILHRLAVLVVFALSLVQSVDGFVLTPHRSLPTRTAHGPLSAPPAALLSFNPAPHTSSRFPLRMARRSTDGTDVGIYIFGFVLAVNVWLFTIPPSFRRTNICSVSPPDDTTVLVAATTTSPSCVSLEEWASAVGDYYRGGGGIQWDFSINPATLAKNEKFVKTVLGDE